MTSDKPGAKPPASDKTPWVTAVYNQKGGVGKTTTAANLAVCLAAAGARVLLVDLDSQGNATTSLGANYNQDPGAYDFLVGARSFEDCVRTTQYGALMLLPATRQLAGLELELADLEVPQTVIKSQLDGLPPAFDHILIDCPPALGMVPVNALIAADGVLVPVQCEQFAHDGLVNALYSLNRIRSTFHPYLQVSGILITMVADDGVSQDLEKTMRSEFADQMFRAAVPRDSAVAAAAAHDHPVVTDSLTALATDAYVSVLEEFLHREQRQRLKFGKLRKEVATSSSLPPLPPFCPDPADAVLRARSTLNPAGFPPPGGYGTDDEDADNPFVVGSSASSGETTMAEAAQKIIRHDDSLPLAPDEDGQEPKSWAAEEGGEYEKAIPAGQDRLKLVTLAAGGIAACLIGVVALYALGIINL